MTAIREALLKMIPEETKTDGMAGILKALMERNVTPLHKQKFRQALRKIVSKDEKLSAVRQALLQIAHGAEPLEAELFVPKIEDSSFSIVDDITPEVA